MCIRPAYAIQTQDCLPLCLFLKSMSIKAVIAGASGLIGSTLVKQILTNAKFTEVVLLSRRLTGVYRDKVSEEIVDFDHLEKSASLISGDIIFSCLGTTKSKTPDPSTYHKIEYDYTLSLAQIGLEQGVSQFHYVSSLGADSSSSNSYLRLKGEVEEALKNLPFKSVHIYQPSYITGERREKRWEDSLIKPVMRLLNPLLSGKLSKYKSITAESVVSTMLKQSLKNLEGTFTYPSNIIQQLS